MSKDPAFLFYPNDWLGGTMGMTYEEKGAYIDALVMQWNCHRITEAHAKHILSCDLWNKIKYKFKNDEKGFYNQRLDDEIKKRTQYSKKQRENALKRWEKKGVTNAMPPHCNGIDLAMPLENRNINRNINIYKEKIVKRGKKFIPPTIDEIKAYCHERRNNIDPQYFFDYQLSRDWIMSNGKKMRDWKATIRTWEKNNFAKKIERINSEKIMAANGGF